MAGQQRISPKYHPQPPNRRGNLIFKGHQKEGPPTPTVHGTNTDCCSDKGVAVTIKGGNGWNS